MPGAAESEDQNAQKTERPALKRYSVEEKRRILRLVDAAADSHQVGAILRREGLYYSTLRGFREQQAKGLLEPGAAARERDRRTQSQGQERELARLTRENERLRRQLEDARTIIDVQKKVAQLLGRSLEEAPTNGS